MQDQPEDQVGSVELLLAAQRAEWRDRIQRRPAWPVRFLRRVLPRRLRLKRLKPEEEAAHRALMQAQRLDTRQQRRTAAFRASFAAVSRQYEGEPRRARRRIARRLMRHAKEGLCQIA